MKNLIAGLAGSALRKKILSRPSLSLLPVIGCSLLFALAANERRPLAAPEPERREFAEMPAQRFIENLPPTANLPATKDRSTKVAAFRAISGPGPVWTALGPFPIPNGQTENRVDPVSGRVTAIAIHPASPLIAYVGTAQGGVYRTLDGGITWTQLMDNASSGLIGTPLAIGAVTIDPTNSSNVNKDLSLGRNLVFSYL